jgi:hypothetical protein
MKHVNVTQSNELALTRFCLRVTMTEHQGLEDPTLEQYWT